LATGGGPSFTKAPNPPTSAKAGEEDFRRSREMAAQRLGAIKCAILELEAIYLDLSHRPA